MPIFKTSSCFFKIPVRFPDFGYNYTSQTKFRWVYRNNLVCLSDCSHTLLIPSPPKPYREFIKTLHLHKTKCVDMHIGRKFISTYSFKDWENLLWFLLTVCSVKEFIIETTEKARAISVFDKKYKHLYWIYVSERICEI